MGKFIAFLKNNFYIDIIFTVIFVVILVVPYCNSQFVLTSGTLYGQSNLSIEGYERFVSLNDYIFKNIGNAVSLTQDIFFVIAFLIIVAISILSIFLKKQRLFFYPVIALGYLMLLAIFSTSLGETYYSSSFYAITTPHVGYFLTLICLIWYITAFVFLLIDFFKNKKSTPMQDTNATA